MFKNWWNNIKSWFSDLFHGNLKFGYGSKDWQGKSSWEELHDRQDVMLDQAQANNELTSTPYSGADSVNDLYANYNAVGGTAFNSLVNKYAEAGITGQQAALNEMQLDNQRRQYAFQVQGMDEAGLNPALMYESGATTAPSAPAPTAGASMSEIIQLMLADKQARLLKAQTDNTEADTDKKKAETENMNLINKYYPDLTDSQIKKIMSDIGINDERIKEIQSQVNLNELDVQLKGIEKCIKQAEADESSAYYKATRELQEAKTEEARNSAREKLADALMKEIEGEYERNTNTKMSSSSLLAIASALGTIFSNSDHFTNWFRRNIYDKDKEYGWIIEKLQEWSDSRFAKKAEIAGASRYGGSRD